jgi:peroxiredoxin
MRILRTSILLGLTLIIWFAAACGGETNSGTPEIKNAKLEVGDRAPDFRLPDHTGGYIRLSDFQGKQNVVIAFYPAAFTPV